MFRRLDAPAAGHDDRGLGQLHLAAGGLAHLGHAGADPRRIHGRRVLHDGRDRRGLRRREDVGPQRQERERPRRPDHLEGLAGVDGPLDQQLAALDRDLGGVLDHRPLEAGGQRRQAVLARGRGAGHDPGRGFLPHQAGEQFHHAVAGLEDVRRRHPKQAVGAEAGRLGRRGVVTDDHGVHRPPQRVGQAPGGGQGLQRSLADPAVPIFNVYQKALGHDCLPSSLRAPSLPCAEAPPTASPGLRARRR